MTKTQKVHLFAAILFAAGAVFWCVMLVVHAVDCASFGAPKEQFEQKTFEFHRYELKYNGKRHYYLVYVADEALPLWSDTLVYADVDVKVLDNIRYGDEIQCVVAEASNKSFSYEILELNSAKGTALTFERYMSRHKTNSIVGIVVCSLSLAMCGVLSVVGFRGCKGGEQAPKQ